MQGVSIEVFSTSNPFMLPGRIIEFRFLLSQTSKVAPHPKIRELMFALKKGSVRKQETINQRSAVALRDDADNFISILAGSARYTPPPSAHKLISSLRVPAGCDRENPAATGMARPRP
jgi:hypothetical protein